MATINVLDAIGTSTPVEKPNTNGRAAATLSRPVALSNEDLAALVAATPAAVTTAAPTYTTGTTQPVSMDTAGNLRVVDASVVTSLGTDATGVTTPTGATGVRGWLSGIFAGIGTAADTVWNGIAASASSIALLKYIATAATAAGDNVIGRVKTVDAAGNVITSTAVNNGLTGAKQRLDVNLAAAVTPNTAKPTVMEMVGGQDGTNAQAFLTDTAGRLAVNVNGTVTAVGQITAPQFTPTVTAGAVVVANTTNASASLTVTSVVSGALVIGQSVTGVGIPAGTTILSGTGPYTLSANATATNTGVTVTANGYSTGQVIGGLIQFTGQPSTGYVASGIAALASGTFSGTIDILLFNANPTSTFTDRATLTILAADLPKLIGVLHLTDLTGSGTQSILQGVSLGQPYVMAGTTIYAVAVLRGSVALVSTTDLTATLQVVR